MTLFVPRTIPARDPIPDTTERRWRRRGARMFARAMDDNIGRIVAAVRSHPHPARMLDLGCWDGATTVRYASPNVALFGVERCAEAARYARQLGIDTTAADLNADLPFADSSFDLVTSNQVIEHLADTDRFIAESHRVLRPGGMLVCSTENLASWHNIAALLLGWQAFSLTNVSRTGFGLGNPMANLRGEDPLDPGWEHMRIFSYRGLAELVQAHGFTDVHVFGAGYYPLPSSCARFDPRHAAFLTVRGIKPGGSSGTG
jgi:SAM-dependent methyltransferase